MFTAARTENNGQISSVVRFYTISQAREFCASNGHKLVTGYAAKAAMRAGAPVRLMHSDGKVRF